MSTPKYAFGPAQSRGLPPQNIARGGGTSRDYGSGPSRGRGGAGASRWTDSHDDRYHPYGGPSQKSSRYDDDRKWGKSMHIYYKALKRQGRFSSRTYLLWNFFCV